MPQDSPSPNPQPTVEVLHIEGCDNAPRAVTLAETVIQDLGLDLPVQRVLVTDPQHAAELRFPGSPTIRVNGEDLEGDGGTTGFG